MGPEFFGDRKDFIKKEFIHGLAPGNGWAVHPMYFSQFPRKYFVEQYARFLGIRRVEGHIYDRNLLTKVGNHCRSNLFLDPDKGLPTPQNANGINGDGWKEYVAIDELAEIATAPGRRRRLTLVYDERNPWYLNVQRWRGLAQNKLDLLFQQNLYGAAYVASHVFLIWVSHDRGTVTDATRRIMSLSRLPVTRFVGDGA